MSIQTDLTAAVQIFSQKNPAQPATNGDISNVLNLINEVLTLINENSISAVIDSDTDPVVQDGSVLLTVGQTTVRIASSTT